MPAVLEITKNNVVKSAVKLISTKGWEELNARSLAKAMGISTKPLYRIFSGMEEIKEEVYKEIYKQYDEYITSRIDSKKALLTLCIAYVEFAQKYKNLFISLFLSNNLKWKNINDVFDEKWNQSTIVNLVNKQGLTFTAAKELFQQMWLYSNGLATLVATNDIIIEEKEIMVKIVKTYKCVIK